MNKLVIKNENKDVWGKIVEETSVPRNLVKLIMYMKMHNITNSKISERAEKEFSYNISDILIENMVNIFNMQVLNIPYEDACKVSLWSTRDLKKPQKDIKFMCDFILETVQAIKGVPMEITEEVVLDFLGTMYEELDREISMVDFCVRHEASLEDWLNLLAAKKNFHKVYTITL